MSAKLNQIEMKGGGSAISLIDKKNMNQSKYILVIIKVRSSDTLI